MPKQTGLQENFYIEGFNISGDVGSLGNLGSPRPTMPSNGIDSAAMERLLLRGDAIMEFNVFFNDAAAQEHLALSTLPTGDRRVTWVQGTSIGNVGISMVAKQVNFDWTKNPDGSVEGTVQCLGQGVTREDGEMLTAGAITHSAATNGPSTDDAASSANGIAGYLHVFAFTGTSCTVAIQESFDDGSSDPFTAKATFAAASGVTAERITASGTVERYLRVSSSGTFSNCQFAVMYRRGAAEDDLAYA